MTYAFIIVVSAAITIKLLFLSFSIYFTMKDKGTTPLQIQEQTQDNKKSMSISWRQIQQMFLRKTLLYEDLG